MTYPTHDTYNDIEEVRVIPAGSRPPFIDPEEPVAYVQVERSPQQQAQDDLLDRAETAAKAALEQATEAIAWLSVLGPVKESTAPIYLRKLLEEIAEVRRVRQ